MFERMLAKQLQEKGYWCHIFEYNSNGQPCDIVALRSGKSLLIDVKHCDNDSFQFSRVEQNQASSFSYASNVCGIEHTGFAIYFEADKKWHWLPYALYKSLKDIHTSSVKYFILKEMEQVI